MTTPAKARVGGAVFLIAFAVLCAAAAPGLYLRDSGELTTAAFTLGIAHETGFALFCLLGKAAALVPLGEVATRLNLFSALSGALTAYLAWRILHEAGSGDLASEIAGAGAAALLIADYTFFKSSTVAEVYAPTAAAIALALLLFLRASRGDRRAALGLALVGGLSLGLHAQLRILVGPPVALWALWRLRRGDRWPLLAPFAVALGAAVVVYLPLRAARTPAADWADPRTLGAMLDQLSAARIRRSFSDQILQGGIASWDHARLYGGLLEAQLGVPALLAALAGLVALLRARATRSFGLLLFVLLTGDALYSIFINPMGLADLQDGTPTALAIALLAGAGLAAAARAIGARTETGRGLALGRAGAWAAGALAVVICVPAALAEPDGRVGLGPEAARWTSAAFAEAPPRALVLTTSDDLSAGALYEQAVAGARPDVTALVRQQLWDGALVAQRIAHAGGEVRDPFAGRSARARILHQDQIEQALVTRERSARAVLWEPAGDAPPIAPEKVLPGVPLAQLEDSAAPLPPARPLAERVQALLSPGRDPLVQRMRAAVLCALGRLYLARSDDARAAGLFGAALGELPSDAVAATNLGVVRARHGDYAQAAALVDRVLARDPSRQVARLNSGRYHLELGQLDLAEHQFSLARARAPRDPAPLVGLGRVAERRGDRALARSYAALALKLAPGDREAHDFSLEMNR